MTQERFEQLLERFERSGTVRSKETRREDLETITTAIVESAGGEVKLEFRVKPRFLGTKTSYTKRIGAGVAVEPQYSTDELVTVFAAYRKDPSSGEWLKMDPEAMR